MRLAAGLAVVALLLLPALRPAAAGQSDLPRVLILATGGTIAGEQREPGTLGPYEIRRPIEEIVGEVPEIYRHAELETEQFLNIASSGITPEHWLQLAQRINTILAKRPDLAGIVVTHGTDRLAETAYFLHLTIRSDRPVVVVGAYRPATGISPDGPLNLLSAVRVAASAQAPGKGAMVVMDERIISARDAHKIYARNGGFDDGEMGIIGVVAAHGVEFFYAPARRHTFNSEFDVSAIGTMPRVDVHYLYAGSVPPEKTDAKGIILAATAISPDERSFYADLRRTGIVVAMTFPSGSQVLSPSSTEQGSPSIIAVQRLLPTHARILLMLGLTATQDLQEIQRIFNTY